MDQETDELEQDSSVDDETVTEESESEENNDSDTKKSNSSNFKALSKSKRELERKLATKDEELARAQEELRQWRELNTDTAKDLDKAKDVDSIKEEIFTLKNPDAEPYLKEIRATMVEFNTDYAKAWKFVKSDIPAESKSKRDFELSNHTPKKQVDISKVSEADSVDLSKEDRAKWRKLNGYA